MRGRHDENDVNMAGILFSSGVDVAYWHAGAIEHLIVYCGNDRAVHDIRETADVETCKHYEILVPTVILPVSMVRAW